MNYFFLVMGESGSGKDTFVNQICRTTGANKLLSYTTRPKRPNETGTHLFIDESEYKGLLRKVARTTYAGFNYCATQEQVEESDIYIIDPAGLEYFKLMYGGSKELMVIRIKCPWFIRLVRMLRRGDSFLGAIERLWNDSIVFKRADKMADVIVRVKWKIGV